MGQMTVFSGPERRRRWSYEQCLQILTKVFAPGACPSDVARRHDISTGQLYTWRSKLAVDAAPSPDDEHGPGFAEALVIHDGVPALSGSGAAIVVDLPRSRRVSIFASASPALAAAASKALR